MKSFFFNVLDSKYTLSTLYKQDNQFIKRVDISSGLVFYDLLLYNNPKREIVVKNLDRMIVFCIIKSGEVSIKNGSSKILKKDNIYLFSSSKQDFSLTLEKNKKSDMFVLFIADFILKRYLSNNTNDPLDFLYQQTQTDKELQLINQKPLDSLSLHFIDKIKEIDNSLSMQNFLAQQRVMEFMAHQFILLDIKDETIDEESYNIAIRAKKELLKSFKEPPSIERLAHLCATNQTKLKSVFKEVHKTTVYGYVQKLRLQEATYLLKKQELSIGEVAKRVGYKHQGYFSKLFFRTYGIYPKGLLNK